MRDPIRYAAWQHTILTSYVWILASIPLGNWNRQRGERLIPALLSGHGIGADDLSTLAFITLPTVFCWVAYKRRNIWFAGLALLFDAVWLWMQIRTWWIPYILGAPRAWQVEYAHGPTTKVLPSFGSHLAPDGMHFVMHVLLVAAMATAVLGIRQLAESRRLARTTAAGPR